MDPQLEYATKRIVELENLLAGGCSGRKSARYV